MNEQANTQEANTPAIPAGYLKDRKGRLVPESIIDPYDLELDAFVKRHVARAEALRDAMAAFKADTLADCTAWMDLIGEKYGRKGATPQGNVTFSTFDGECQLSISTDDLIRLGPEIHIAKAFFGECLDEWSANSNENLIAMVRHDSFDLDKEGNVSVSRVLSLLKIGIQDERWVRMQKAIKDAIIVKETKSYLNFKRKAEDGSMKQIPLSIAAL